jgi:hypothetical protein
MRPKDADRLSALDEQRLVILQRAERVHDRVERLPIPSGAAGAAVDDEIRRPFGDVGIEVVHEHPQRRLLLPPLAGDLAPARRTDHAWLGAPSRRNRCRHGLLTRNVLP